MDTQTVVDAKLKSLEIAKATFHIEPSSLDELMKRAKVIFDWVCQPEPATDFKNAFLGEPILTRDQEIAQHPIHL